MRTSRIPRRILSHFAILLALGSLTACPLPTSPTAPIPRQRVDLRSQLTLGFPTQAGRSFGSDAEPTLLRNQGPRGTCITFSAIAALEAAYNKAGYGDLDFSEEFLNYVGKMGWLHYPWTDFTQRLDQRLRFPGDGRGTVGRDDRADMATFSIEIDTSTDHWMANWRESQVALFSGGGGAGYIRGLATGQYRAVQEMVFPYTTDRQWQLSEYPAPMDDWASIFWRASQWEASSWNLNPERLSVERLSAPMSYAVRSYEDVPPTNVEAYKRALRAGYPVVFDTETPSAPTGIWRPDGIPRGALGNPHSMLIVGFDERDVDPNNHYFIVKNSWGPASHTDECSEDGFTCISFRFVRTYATDAAYISAVEAPRPWSELAFLGRWDMSFDGQRGTLDVYHLPGSMDELFRQRSAGNGRAIRDRRIGTFYDVNRRAYRVNGKIAGNLLEMYIDWENPNADWETLAGRRFQYRIFETDKGSMAGLHVDPDGSVWGGYARRSFDRTGFLAERTTAQTFTPGSYLGNWHVSYDGTILDVRLEEVSPWTRRIAGREYAQIVGHSVANAGGDRHELIAWVPLDEPARIEFDLGLPSGETVSLRGRRLSWERDVFTGFGNERGFYATREDPRLSLAIISPLEGSSFSRGQRQVSFSARVTGASEVEWRSDRDGLIGSGSSFIRTDLSFGDHEVTATALGRGGETAQAQVSITITNDPPVVQIRAPADGSDFCTRQSITLVASARDPNNVPTFEVPEAGISWRIGSGTPFATGSTATHSFEARGRYVITVRASDEQGLSDEVSTTIDVRECAGSAPSAQIIAPPRDSGLSDDAFVYDGFDEARMMWYKDVRLRGTASDVEDGILSGIALEWFTDRTNLQTGLLGTGNDLTVRLYSDECTGTWHNVRLEAIDSARNRSSPDVRRIFIWTLC